VLKDRVAVGFNDWLVPKRPDGVAAFSRGGSTVYTAKWLNLSGGTYARTICAGIHTVEFNTDFLLEYQNDDLSIRAVATHEFGHAFGISHSQYDLQDITGKTASGDWLFRPSMGTCLSASETANLAVLSQDDEAAVMYTVDQESLGGVLWKGVTANSSFENGLTHWRRSGGGQSSLRTTGGAVGPQYLAWLGADVTMYNTTRYIPLDQTLSDQYPTFLPDGRIRKNAATDTGFIRMTLMWRPVGYDNVNNPCGNPFPRNYHEDNYENLNDVASIVFPWQMSAMNCTPTSTTWQRCGTSTVAPTDGYDAYDVQLQLRNNMNAAGGGSTWALADWSRVTVYDIDDLSG